MAKNIGGAPSSIHNAFRPKYTKLNSKISNQMIGTEGSISPKKAIGAISSGTSTNPSKQKNDAA
jgi:hypothetical protein